MHRFNLRILCKRVRHRENVPSHGYPSGDRIKLTGDRSTHGDEEHAFTAGVDATAAARLSASASVPELAPLKAAQAALDRATEALRDANQTYETVDHFMGRLEMLSCPPHDEDGITT